MDASNLKMHPMSPEFLFNENIELVEALRRRYPNMDFKVTLSLGDFPESRNLHKLPINYIVQHADLDSPSNYFGKIIDGLFDFVDSVAEHMHRSSIKKATVHLSRIEIGSNVSTATLRHSLYANLRAVFINE